MAQGEQALEDFPFVFAVECQAMSVILRSSLISFAALMGLSR